MSEKETAPAFAEAAPVVRPHRNADSAALISTSPINVAEAEAAMARAWATRKVAAGVNGCHIWVGSRDRDGYGRVWCGNAVRRAHRVAWVAFHGRDIPAGMTLDHLCRVRSCLSPLHLEVVSNRENNLRGESPAAANARATRCPRGHLLGDGNVHPSEVALGRRSCRACDRLAARRRHILIAYAHRGLGMTYHRYVPIFGRSDVTTEAVLTHLGIFEYASWFADFAVSDDDGVVAA